MVLLTNSNKNKRKYSRGGFSVVELLIAAGLTVLILGVVGLVYVSSNRSFKYGQAVLNSEADLRLAMEWITRDIRKAKKIQVTKGIVDGDDVILLDYPGEEINITFVSGSTVYTVNSDDGEWVLKRNGVDPDTINRPIVTVSISSPVPEQTDIIISSSTSTISGTKLVITSPTVEVALSSTQTILGRRQRSTLTSKITMRNAE